MNWDSFKLRNDRLTRLVQEISNTGLGSVDEIYVSLIPALSAENKLPDPSAVVELAHKHAKRYLVQQDWKKAFKPYLWLSDIARSFPKDSVPSVRSIAVLLECVRIMTQEIEMRGHTDEDGVFDPLVKAKSNIEFQIKLWLESNDSLTSQTILSHLMTLYNEQGRKWRWDSWETSQDPTTIPNTTTDYPHTFGFSRLHRLCQEGRQLANEIGMTALNPGQSVKQPDVMNWTPLHYIAVNGGARSVELLLGLDADVHGRDLVDWTPLHYACQRGNRSTVRSLLRAGADVHLRGIDGVSSLQCVAMGGHADVAELLIKAGAALDILDNAGNTWLHWAAYNGHSKFIEDMKPRLQALETNGTKINVENHARKEPLDLAIRRGHEAVIRLLKDMD
ncbi:Hypothetical protein NCS54_00348600 [Fusarium falciforme]|uniref:Hypothetical protein n=1 Tax=Fusarium falciforme TaxID=195108 RepID=UPI002301E4E8|nr:Hypothetical protein NCS54_00348600 [Fusarium falciforme]WAO86220.1 Hypothetical protein NCS54_00348600 [Fusarium falciforme]